MKEVLQRTQLAWQTALSNRLFMWQFIISVLFFVSCSKFNFYCLNLWEFRQGATLNDFVLDLLPATDFSNIIFFFTYFTILSTIISALPYPGTFVRGLQAYSILLLARVVSIYLFPLNPPADMVLLVDPIGEFFLHQEVTVTKDLFFSGHTATLVLMFMLAQNKYVKTFATIALCVVPLLLIWQHVHYTIDIVVAPFAAVICVKVVEWANQKSTYGKILYQY
jgi:hypothetical protein